MPGTWNIKDHTWIIAVGLALLFLIVCAIFSKQIHSWLEDKEDFSINGDSNRIFSLPGKGLKNENKCREIFQSLFQRPFPSVRPSFLKRSNGRALELDGYGNLA